MRPSLAVACGLVGLALPSVAGAPPPPLGCRPRPAIAAVGVSGAAADRLRALPSTTRGDAPGEHLLADGRILFQAEPGGDGTVYTRAGFRQRNAELAEELRFRRVSRGESFHPLRGLIDDGAAFVAELPTLGGQLRHRLDREGIDEKDPLAALGRLGERWRGSRCRLDPALFRELTAALGEALLRRAPTARWTTRTVDAVVEPVVELQVGGDKRLVPPWQWAEELLAGETDLAGRISEALQPRLFFAPPPPIDPPAVDAGKPAEADAGVDGGKGCACPCNERAP